VTSNSDIRITPDTLFRQIYSGVVTESTGFLHRAIVVGAVVALVVVAVVVLRPAVSSVLSAAPPPTVTCDAEMAVFGEPISCVASGGDVANLQWPDAVIGETAGSTHAPMAIGATEVVAVDADGVVLAAVALTITPDIVLECGTSDEEKVVHELAATDLRPEGWDYVYVDPSSGDRVLPGDAAHPGQAPTSTLERIEIARAHSTSICRLSSEAAEAFDGTYELTLESEWEPTMTTQQRIMGPASKTKWAGAQPGTLTGTVTVGSVTASERVGVYLAGCA